MLLKGDGNCCGSTTLVMRIRRERQRVCLQIFGKLQKQRFPWWELPVPAWLQLQGTHPLSIHPLSIHPWLPPVLLEMSKPLINSIMKREKLPVHQSQPPFLLLPPYFHGSVCVWGWILAIWDLEAATGDSTTELPLLGGDCLKFLPMEICWLNGPGTE